MLFCCNSSLYSNIAQLAFKTGYSLSSETFLQIAGCLVFLVSAHQMTVALSQLHEIGDNQKAPIWAVASTAIWNKREQFFPSFLYAFIILTTGKEKEVFLFSLSRAIVNKLFQIFLYAYGLVLCIFLKLPIRFMLYIQLCALLFKKSIFYYTQLFISLNALLKSYFK